MDTEKTTTSGIVELYLRGVSPERISAELAVSPRRIGEVLEGLEAVLLLVAHDFPPSSISKVARIGAEEAEVYLAEIRSRFDGRESVKAFAAERGLLDAGGPANGNGGGSSSAGVLPPVTPPDDAQQALDVLDFWASKWL